MEKNKSKTIGGIKNNRGITLLALAVTIVVLLILTSIGIKLTLGNNGIIGEAKNAKEQAEIDEEKGIVKRATTVSLIRSKGSKVEQNTLEKALDDETGEGKTEVNDVGEVFEVVFVDSNRYYEVDEDGNISDVNKTTKDDYAGDITKGGRCDGSEEKPYEISCIEDLVAFSNMSNGTGFTLEKGEAIRVAKMNNFAGKYIILTRSLNFKSKYSYDDYSRTDFGDLNGDDTDGNMLMTEMTTGTGWKHIGLYQGIFDGQNNMIQNIYTKNYGLFYSIQNATIKNLGISGEINSASYAGGIATTVTSSVVENCYNKANIVALDGTSIGYGTGGVVGTLDQSKIVNCYNEGKITGESCVGGIVGGCKSQSEIILCYNNGEIYSNGTKTYRGVGGISGGIYGYEIIVNGCYNNGNIGGTNSASGGIVGEMYTAGSVPGEALILNCYNNGKINNANNNSGGIFGTISLRSSSDSLTAKIENCYNINSISSSTSGGIIGYTSKIYETASCTISINNCYNYGNVIGTLTGGIIGKNYRINLENIEVKNCYYTEKQNKVVGQGSVTETNVEIKKQDYMKSIEFVNLLNSNIGSDNVNWKKWKLGSNGYPTFEE